MRTTGTTPEPHRTSVAEQLTAPQTVRPPRRRRLAAAVLTAVAATALAGGSLATTAAPAQAATDVVVGSVVDGGRYTLGTYSGLVLDNPGGSTADETVPIGWEANGGFNQVWKFAAAGDGYYKIINNASGKCLDLLGGTGTTVGQYLCDPNSVNQPNQLWKPVSLGGSVFEFRLKLNNQRLSLIGANQWILTPTAYSVTTSKYSLRAGQAASVRYACDGGDGKWEFRTEGIHGLYSNVVYQSLSTKGMGVSATQGQSRTAFQVSYTNAGTPSQTRDGQIRFYCDPEGF